VRRWRQRRARGNDEVERFRRAPVTHVRRDERQTGALAAVECGPFAERFFQHRPFALEADDLDL
jgi:hypothetical protein